MNVYDLFGIVGVVLIITAYFLLQINKLSSNDIKFSLLNFFGSLLIIVSLFYKWNLPSFIIEFFWMLISVIGIVRYFKNRDFF
jgi:hypothetical protein